MSVTTSPTPVQIQALAKTAAAHRNATSPSAFVRVIAVRAYSLGVSDQQLLLFLRKQVGNHQGLARFLKQTTPLRRVLAAAKRASLINSPAAATKNSQRVARLVVGRFLSPIGDTKSLGQVDDDLDDEAWAEAIAGAQPVEAKPLSLAVQLRTRVALAVAAGEVLKSINGPSGWTTAQISYARMNLATGWTTTTSKRALNDLVQLRLIAELPSGRKATARRFKINGSLNPSQREVAAGQYETIGTLMGCEGAASLAAALISSVNHAAWNFGPSPLSHRAWLVATADAAGIDPAGLAISKRNISLARKALTAAGLGNVTTAEELSVVLDRYAAANGCAEAKRQAEEEYRLAADARAEEVKHFQGLKVDSKEILDSFTGEAAKIPKLETSSGRKFATWLATSSEAFDGRAYPAEMATMVVTELAKRIGKRLGGDAAAGKIVAGWILAGLEVEDLDAKRAVQIKAARGLEILGAGLANVPAGTASEFEQKAWLKELQGKVTAGRPMAPAMRDAVAADLRGRLLVRGYSEDKASKGSAWVVRDVALTDVAVAA